LGFAVARPTYLSQSIAGVERRDLERSRLCIWGTIPAVNNLMRPRMCSPDTTSSFRKAQIYLSVDVDVNVDIDLKGALKPVMGMGSIGSELKGSYLSAAAVRLKNHTEADRFPRPCAPKTSHGGKASGDIWSSYRAIAVAYRS